MFQTHRLLNEYNSQLVTDQVTSDVVENNNISASIQSNPVVLQVSLANDSETLQVSDISEFSAATEDINNQNPIDGAALPLQYAASVPTYCSITPVSPTMSSRCDNGITIDTVGRNENDILPILNGEQGMEDGRHSPFYCETDNRNVAEQLQTSTLNLGDVGTKHECDLCHKHYSSARNLKAHLKVTHSGMVNDWFQYLQCLCCCCS